jgi:hypothetical protein
MCIFVGAYITPHGKFFISILEAQAQLIDTVVQPRVKEMTNNGYVGLRSFLIYPAADLLTSLFTSLCHASALYRSVT